MLIEISLQGTMKCLNGHSWATDFTLVAPVGNTGQMSVEHVSIPRCPFPDCWYHGEIEEVSYDDSAARG